MEVLSWNCRGICNDITVQALKKLIRQHHPSFIFLCETKVRDRVYLNDLRLQIGYLNCEAVFSEGQSGGLALFWRDGLDVRFRSKSNHHVDVEVHSTDGSHIFWRLTGFYGHPTTSERYRTWSLLRNLSDESSLPWAVVGDFNELLHASKQIGGRIRREGQMQLFRDALSYCDLFDLGFLGAPFTWNRSEVKSRLDRVVVSAAWSDTFSHARVLNLAPIQGDHVPILLGIFHSPTLVSKRKFRFRFESYWLQNVDCDGIVQSSWDICSPGSPMHQVTQKIIATRLSLNKWQKETFGHRGREMEMIRRRLQVLLGQFPSGENQQESFELSNRLEWLLAADSAYWKQRSKITWLADGDRNTKFFHRKASNRKAKNRLIGLYDDNGVCQSSDQGMEDVVLRYFSGMFQAADMDVNHMNSVVELIQPKVTSTMNVDLCANYTEVEIRTTLFQMYPTKAPGPYGMPPLFFLTLLGFSWA